MNLHCDESCADHDECEYEHNPNLCWQKAVEEDSGIVLRGHTTPSKPRKSSNGSQTQ